ncbi:hypothetical protein DXG03_008426 [Asterophora parasitica]|uniref:UBL3-like ubiquitin domain-containing protein n=1 Tax=Asterophora parasitica TaxID=117018 RepID=A0A9P7GFH9_9AGAR|nr:hypothetical protein DXG03_008426 [Asterophora parasitica]
MDNSGQVESASTTQTQLEMIEAGTSARILEARPAAPISHEPPLPPPKIDNSTPQAREEEAKEETGEVHALQTPQVFITFLVISGRRKTMSFEPETTLGRLKELVWNAWPTELKFPTHTPQTLPAPTPTIVHLSIRPHAAPGEHDLKKKRHRNRTSDGETYLLLAGSKA